MPSHPDVKSRKQRGLTDQESFVVFRTNALCRVSVKKIFMSSYIVLLEPSYFLHVIRVLFCFFSISSRNGLTLIHSHFFSFECGCFHAWTLGSKYKRQQPQKRHFYVCTQSSHIAYLSSVMEIILHSFSCRKKESDKGSFLLLPYSRKRGLYYELNFDFICM